MKKGSVSSSIRRMIIRRKTKKQQPDRTPLITESYQVNNNSNTNNNTTTLADMVVAGASGTGTKSKKKGSGARLWMRMDKLGQSEVIECDKSTIIKRVGVPTRDLRVLLGPVFSHSSNILAREKAIIVNLEFIKAIVTAEEILLLDPLRKEVVPFVDQLRLQFSQRSPRRIDGAGQLAIHDTEHLTTPGQWLQVSEAVEGFQAELPFEFQILEIALELVCTSLESSVADLERVAYPVLDELARNVSTKNLEHVRSLKSNLTRLLARVQKVRDEIEHLLDDNEDMAHLYLTRKLVQLQQSEALIGSMASNNVPTSASNLRRLSSARSGSLVTSNYSNDNDVEDLEMLLEAYFMQLDGTRNKILSVREYIDDTEDYVNIQLDNQRNELIQLQLTLTIASFAIAVETLVAGMFGMNIPCELYDMHGIFGTFVGVLTAVCVLIFFVVLGYARWKKLLGS
ncbi:Magnesium transporter [Heracleum sosnowskyi]|uniref:Magnesium transporter n=1 Tax=Heracleum sosnowskyi TaxID=360622 RepID=A0AAD8IHU1_9APIA|nr:Magnesium transporter [Heracleum sosnowskyi]